MLRKKGLIDQPRSLGQYLRNGRLIQGLRQEEVAAQLGTLREVYERWERDERQPVVSEWPGILSFLGYYPSSDETAPDLVLKACRCLGIDQKGLAKIVGVTHQRLRSWEEGKEPVPDGMEGHLENLISSVATSEVSGARLMRTAKV